MPPFFGSPGEFFGSPGERSRCSRVSPPPVWPDSRSFRRVTIGGDDMRACCHSGRSAPVVAKASGRVREERRPVCLLVCAVALLSGDFGCSRGGWDAREGGQDGTGGLLMMLTGLAVSDTAVSSFSTATDHIAQGFEALGALILVVGVVWSLVLAVLVLRRPGSGKQAYTVLRQAFGGTLLLALEILVAADLVRTVAVSPTPGNVLVLGIIVLIRTVLSFSLEIEIDGVLPWRRALASGAGTIKKATQTARGRAASLTGRALR